MQASALGIEMSGERFCYLSRKALLMDKSLNNSTCEGSTTLDPFETSLCETAPAQPYMGSSRSSSTIKAKSRNHSFCVIENKKIH